MEILIYSVIGNNISHDTIFINVFQEYLLVLKKFCILKFG